MFKRSFHSQWQWFEVSIKPILFYCWPTVFDAGPTLNQYWYNVLCLLAADTGSTLLSSDRANIYDVASTSTPIGSTSRLCWFTVYKTSHVPLCVELMLFFMLGRRRRRRANIKTALVYRPVFPGSPAINLSGGRETDGNTCITMTSDSKRNMLYLYLYANYN